MSNESPQFTIVTKTTLIWKNHQTKSLISWRIWEEKCNAIRDLSFLEEEGDKKNNYPPLISCLVERW